LKILKLIDPTTTPALLVWKIKTLS